MQPEWFVIRHFVVKWVETKVVLVLRRVRQLTWVLRQPKLLRSIKRTLVETALISVNAQSLIDLIKTGSITCRWSQITEVQSIFFSAISFYVMLSFLSVRSDPNPLGMFSNYKAESIYTVFFLLYFFVKIAICRFYFKWHFQEITTPDTNNKIVFQRF